MEIFDRNLLEKIMKNDGRVPSDATNSCCAEPKGVFPAYTPIGMCYVPMQKWDDLYDEAEGLERGTIFKALDKPFTGERGVFYAD